MGFQGQAWLGVACAFALSACVAGTGPGTGPAAPGDGPAAFSPVSVERDVEAPQVFNLTGQGLWDGRPSLGGVWVAHSSVTDPERVIIRNPKNGKSVVGALFRREREMPGPGLQVSSDAAEALGMIAGQPAELGVVALRREEKPVPADAEIGPGDEVPAAMTAEAPAGAGAAPAAAAAAPAATPEPAAAATADVAAEPAPKTRRGLFGFLRKKPAAETAAAPAGAGVGTIEQSTLDPVAASAAAAIDRAPAASPAASPAAVPAAAKAAPAATAAAAQTPAATAAAVPAAPAALTRGDIQIGICSTQANADRAAGQMRAAGMSAAVRPDQSNGKTYWRVIVGPAASVAERDAFAARVKGIGYPDAYPVTN